jgi:hypothetical protein
MLIKDEDINMLPEAMDLAEIDKLTGVPRPKGKLTCVLHLQTLFIFRLTTICGANVGALQYSEHIQV